MGKMQFNQITIALFLYMGMCSAAIDVRVKPVSKELSELIPKSAAIISTNYGSIETVWNLKGLSGSRLLIYCEFYGKTCREAEIIISEENKVFGLCPTQFTNYTYITDSNKATVTIKNGLHEPASKCYVVSTIPFTNHPEIIIDSNEFGTEKKAKEKTSCRCGWSYKVKKNLPGGLTANINEYPFVAILFKKKKHEFLCGACIITARHILTAAHCVLDMNASDIAVNVGEHDISRIDEINATITMEIEQIIRHTGLFNTYYLDNDIAILLLKDRIKFSNQIGRICMPKEQLDMNGKFVKSLGWTLKQDLSNETKSVTEIMKTNLQVLDNSICDMIYQREINDKYINGLQICTYNPRNGTCQGDSGSPVVYLNPQTNMFQLMSIISLTGKCNSIDPSISANVAYYMDWIREMVAETAPVDLCY